MENPQKELKLFVMFACLYVATLLVFNILAAKLWHIGDLVFTAGIILVPITYIFGDILTEVYGYSRTRQVIWIGFAANLLMVIFITIAIALPPAPGWNEQSAFAKLLGMTPRIASASLIAYCVGEFTNSYIIARMKLYHKGAYLWLRMVISTLFGQLVDSTIFITIAFFGTLPAISLVKMIAAVTIFKVSYEILASPLTTKIARYVKSVEHLDIYDRDTSFNPIMLKI